MATTLKLRTDIKKLKGALSSKSLPAPIKAKLKAQLDKAQNELKAMQSGAKPRKVSTTKGTKTALTSLQKLVNKKKFSVYQGKGIDLKKDADQGALAVGRRVSKGIKGNQFGDAKSSKGNVYYEYRANRLDVKQPKGKQKYPKLEDGGMMARGGKIPSNVEEFAKRKGIYSMVSKIAGWAEKAGKKITGGTAIGKNYDTLILDLSYQDNAIYIDIEDGTITIYDEVVNNFNSFKNAIEKHKMASGGNLENWEAPKEIYSGKDIKITIPKMGNFEEAKAIVVYDKENFIFKMYDPTKKRVLVRMSGLDFENNLMNRSYIIDGYMAHGGKTQGYDDKEDERLGMEYGKMSSKDLNSTRARRDDARFEERMAKGGKVRSQEEFNKLVLEKQKIVKNLSPKEVAEMWNKNSNSPSKMTEEEGKMSSSKMYLADLLVENELTQAEQSKYFEDGGYMANGGVLNNKQKLILELHKTLEKANELIMQIYPDTQQEFDKLPWNTRENLIATRKAIYDALSHRFMSGFEKGGYMAQGGVTEKEVVESNAEMVLSKIKEVHHHADELGDIVTNKSDIEAWVVAKIERASTDLSDITHYLDGQHEKMSMGGSINNYVHKMDKK